VKIAGAPSDSSRGTLMAAAFGNPWRADGENRAVRVEARCEVNGAALGQLVSTDAMRREAWIGVRGGHGKGLGLAPGGDVADPFREPT